MGKYCAGTKHPRVDSLAYVYLHGVCGSWVYSFVRVRLFGLIQGKPHARMFVAHRKVPNMSPWYIWTLRLNPA